jgi:hypothetical protein
MSPRLTELTDLKREIIDALANDYESLEQLHTLLDRPISQARLEKAVWDLIQDGYIACFTAAKTELTPVADPQRSRLSTYWFSLTEKGKELLSMLETS